MVKKSFLQKHGGTCTQVDPVVCTPVCVQVHVHMYVDLSLLKL